MTQARELRERGDNPGALARFKAADAIMSVPTTGFEVAHTQADLGLLVEARETLRRVHALPQKEDDPEPFREARKKADALDAELASRIGTVSFAIRGAKRSGVRISVDGEPVPPEAVTLPLRVDPGHHRVIAKSGAREVTRDLDIGERESAELALSFSEEPPSAAQRDASSAPKPAMSSSSGAPTVAYVAGGIGLTGVAVGGVTGLLALSKRNAAETGCNNGKCPPSTWPDLDAAHTFSTVSTIGFIAGAVGIAVGAGSLLFTGDDNHEQSAVVLSPSLSEHGGGMFAYGRF